MDIEYTQQLDFDDGHQEAFTYLDDFTDHLEGLELELIYPYNSQIINLEEFGSIIVISDEEIINIKFTVNSSETIPLKVRKSSKFADISGHEIISNDLHTYILDKKGDLYKFRSSNSLDKVRHENILYLRCFNLSDNCCFVMISKIDSRVTLQLFDSSFDKEHSECKRTVDLILPEDSIQSLENEFSFDKMKEDFTFSCEMIFNILENDLDIEFFSCFLSISVKAENIKDILLVSMNDRLYYVKYFGSFNEEVPDELVSIETIFISRGKIKAMKYLDSSLIILDDFLILTILYQCSQTNVIKRREIPLGDEITCYRFTTDSFVYSNRQKLIFIKFNLAPAEPDIVEVDLRLIATFSVSQDGKFLVAIDKNKFFYYVPVPSFTNQENAIDENYVKVTSEDLKKFPETLRYLESVENDFKSLAETIKYENDILLLLTHLDKNENVIAGHAKVKYLPFLTPSQENDIICDPINSTSGHSYMRIVVDLEKLFSKFKFTIAFYRHTKERGVLVRHIEIEPRNENTNFAIYVPDEIYENSQNKLELFAHFYLNKTGENHALQFPFVIDSIKVSNGYQNHHNIEVEKCKESLKKLFQDDK